MKKILVVISALLVLVGCGSSSAPEQTLRVFNWGEYMDMDLIAEFEEENNVKVIYELFESNEAMYTKLQGGEKYDVIIPSDYMVQRMNEEGLLMELDYSKIPNYSNIIDTLKNRHMDPEGKYTVPYFWGSVGILYNTKEVSSSEVESKGWNIFRDQAYAGKTYYYDSERDAFMVALKALGYSMNTTDSKQIEEAYNWLVEMNKTMQPVYVTDDVIDNMINGIKDLAVVYSGDASYIISENPDMAYYEPKEGTNVWVDTMVIYKDAPNPELAHKWMDFILRETSLEKISEYVGYTSPSQAVIDTLTAPGGTYEGISSYIPRQGHTNDEEFFYDANMKVILSEYWQKVKAAN